MEDNKDKTTTSIDDIEKDLHRSLPEYSAYQSEVRQSDKNIVCKMSDITKVGISTLRRVLTAYSFGNPELGYCQVASLLLSLPGHLLAESRP